MFEADLIFDPDRSSHGHVHSSCIVECPNGDLLSVWYENGPKRDDHYYTKDADKSDDVRIGAARLHRGAKEWSEPFVMCDTFGVADNSPCLAIDREERLWLVYSTMVGAPTKTWDSSILRYSVSSDYQKPGVPRWDKQEILIIHPRGLDEVVARGADELRRFADWDNKNEAIARGLLERLNDPYARRLGWQPRAHPLILSDGTLLIPLANESFGVAAMAMTSDVGETWTISQVVPGKLGVTEPSVAAFPDGKLVVFLRDDTDDHRIKRSESLDNGNAWSPIRATDLPNPSSGIEAILLRSGKLAMVYNDKEEEPRDRLAMSISEDFGETWKWTRRLEDTHGQRFDYPSIIQSRDGSLHVSYSYNLRTIKHVHFDEEWVTGEAL
jgi:predicted neuraminidase